MTARELVLSVLLLAAACGDDLRPEGGSGGSPDGGPPPPDGGTPVVIERDHAGGAPAAVELVDGLAYIALGPRLAIWRDGELVGESDPFPGMISGIAVAGDRVFVAEHIDLVGRVHVVDVSDPAQLVETTSLMLLDEGPTVPRGMAVLDDRLFVADQEQGITEVNITDPDAPAVTRLVPRGGVTELVVAGDRLYYLANSFLGGGVGALDLEDNLADLGETSLFNTNGITVTADDLVVAAGVGGIQVVDVSDLGSPIERYAYSFEEGGPFARAVAASRNRAWIPADDGMYVLDISDPTDVSHTGPFDLDTVGANAADWVAGSVALVTDRGELSLFDVSAPVPSLANRATISLCSDCVGVAVAGDDLAIADFVGGLSTGSVVDLSLVGRSSEPAEMVVFEDVALAGDRAYVADWLYGLRIYDLGDPSAPALLGGVDTAGYPSSVHLQGDRAYIGEATNGGNLRVIDVSVPAEASELGTTTTSQTKDVEVRGDLAFVAEGSLDLVGGMRIFDVSDPDDISLVAHYSEDCAEALDLALTGDLVVVACSFDGFHVLDVSDPANPVRRAVIPASGIASAWSVTAWEGGAALGHDFGVLIADLTDPTAPEIFDEKLTAFTVRALSAPGDGRLVAGCGPGGVYQWALPTR